MIERAILFLVIIGTGILIWKFFSFVFFGAFLFAVFLAFNIGRKRLDV